ncbi:MAG: carbohydrate ABC transporter permease [bacterium]|nr:carbohydrate ABC transporter permease [bacterium]
MKRSQKRTVLEILKWLVGILILSYCLFPVLWLILCSFKTREELYNLPIKYFPKSPTWDAYRDIFTAGTHSAEVLPWQNYLWNSVLVAGISTFFVLGLGALAGYGFSRFKFKGATLMITLLMMSRMLPGPALMLPIYMTISRIGLIDTRFGLILVHTVFGLPLAAILCASFIRAVPVELEEAGIVDGCSRLQVFLKIVIPLAWIGIASVGIFHFVGSWSEFAFASVLLESQKLRTAPIGLAEFVFQFGNAQYNRIGAASVTMALPITILFMLVQKHFVRGLVAGGVKG